MQIASRPRGRLLAPTHSRRSLADQLVVVILREGRREGGREGDGDGDGGEIEGLASVLRPYHSLQSAGSAAVSKLKLTGSAAAPPPLPHCNMAAQPGLTVIRGLRFTSSVPAKRVMMRLGGGDTSPSTTAPPILPPPISKQKSH